MLQTGISHDNKMDTLGFTLEASPARYSSIRKSRLLFGDEGSNLFVCTTQSGCQLGNNFIESDHDSAPSPPGMSSQRTTSESKALVPAKQDVLAVVSVRKSKRPFTVVEVEALVQVVGKLGTGRYC